MENEEQKSEKPKAVSEENQKDNLPEVKIKEEEKTS